MLLIIVLIAKEILGMGLHLEYIKTQFQTFSPNVLKIKFALAGLLTYSTFSAFPSARSEQWHCGEKAFF